jgi:hypothetical protein
VKLFAAVLRAGSAVRYGLGGPRLGRGETLDLMFCATVKSGGSGCRLALPADAAAHPSRMLGGRADRGRRGVRQLGDSAGASYLERVMDVEPGQQSGDSQVYQDRSPHRPVGKSAYKYRYTLPGFLSSDRRI